MNSLLFGINVKWRGRGRLRIEKNQLKFHKYYQFTEWKFFTAAFKSIVERDFEREREKRRDKEKERVRTKKKSEKL